MYDLASLVTKTRTQSEPVRSIKDLAGLLGISVSYLSQIERGLKCPNPDFAEKLSALYGTTRSERRALYFRLLKRILIWRCPEAEPLFARGELLPPLFLRRIIKDMESIPDSRDLIIEGLKIDDEHLEDIFDSVIPISRQQVYTLSTLLRQNPTEYLLLANFMPYEAMEVLRESPNLLEALSKASLR